MAVTNTPDTREKLAICEGTSTEPWLVWSHDHNAFWAPNRCGYTQFIDRAGRYSRAEAEQICRNACPRANSTLPDTDFGRLPPEICFPAPEAADTIEALVEALEANATALNAFIYIIAHRFDGDGTYYWMRDPTHEEAQSAMEANNNAATALSRARNGGQP